MFDDLESSHSRTGIPIWGLMLFVIFFAIISTVSTARAQDCKIKTTTLIETPVFEKPATQFNTSKGWVYGKPLAILAPNVTVFVCDEQTVRFGVISQGWSEIAYWAKGKWQHGWVVTQNLQRAAADLESMFLARIKQFLSIPSVHAQSPVIGENPPANAGPPPPAPAAETTKSATETVASDLYRFYVWLFGFMILGMMGKIMFDMLIETGKIEWKARARAGILPLIVSPIVFLGIMNAADSNAAATVSSFIALCCSAFQNGFFWHTILDRGGVSVTK